MRDSYTPTDAADYNNILRATDQVAAAVGAVVIVDGGAKVGVGLTAAPLHFLVISTSR